MSAPNMLGRPVTGEPVLNYDMSTAPVGGKLLVLNKGGVLVFAVLTLADKRSGHFVAWCALPKRDKEEERRRGLRI
jgi:hypothetical protein